MREDHRRSQRVRPRFLQGYGIRKGYRFDRATHPRDPVLLADGGRPVRAAAAGGYCWHSWRITHS
jgi:hypothetical protein